MALHFEHLYACDAEELQVKRQTWDYLETEMRSFPESIYDSYRVRMRKRLPIAKPANICVFKNFPKFLRKCVPKVTQLFLATLSSAEG